MSTRLAACLLSIVWCWSLSLSAHGANYFVAPCGQDFWAGVDPNCVGPLGPKRTIQAAIDASTHGDTVFVFPGTYVETIDLNGKAITVIGTGGAAATIVDGNGDGPVVTCNSLEGSGTVIQGLTIRNGEASQGGGMLCALSTPTIVECVFLDNHATSRGGGLATVSAWPHVVDCEFIDNSCSGGGISGSGGGMSISGGSPTLEGCSFVENRAFISGGALFIRDGAAPSIDDCVFDDNYQNTYCGIDPCDGSLGGAVAVEGSAPEFIDCVFQANRSASRGAVAVDGGTASFLECDFTANTAFNIGSEDTRGGALYVRGGASVSLGGCAFTDNQSNSVAGAVYLLDSELTLVGVSFTGNSASDTAAAVWAKNSTLDATLCGFHSNELGGPSSGTGGAVASEGSVLTFGLCVFSGNTAKSSGGAVHAEGGSLDLLACTLSSNTALVSKGASAGVVLTNGALFTASGCTFTGNMCSTNGGAIWALPGEEELPEDPTEHTVVITDCSFVDNTGSFGGAVTLSGVAALVEGCTFDSNTAPSGGLGAAMRIGSGTRARLVGTVFAGNESDWVGGALVVEGEATVIGCDFTGNEAGWGGAVLARGSVANAVFIACRFRGNEAGTVGSVSAVQHNGNASFINCAMYSNTAPLGGGTVLNEASSAGAVSVVNCAVVSNTGGGVGNEDAGATVIVANSVVRSNNLGDEIIGGVDAHYSNIEGGFAGEGVIDSDPLFVNPAVGNFRLMAGSPCIDAGRNLSLPLDAHDINANGNTGEMLPLDYDGGPRIMGHDGSAASGCGGAAIVDMGPFEVAGEPAPSFMPGDTNGDGFIDFNDIIAVLASFGACDSMCCPGDVSGDGSVDMDDLMVVLSNWGL